MNPQFWWYLARASGIVAWALLVISTIWGVLLATRVLRPMDHPAWLLDLHRWLGGLALTFTGLHLGALVADSYVHFTFADLVVPFASEWKPGAVAVGVVALWLLVAVQVTSLAMRRLPRRFWRAVHLTSYLMVWTVSIHAGLAGTDVSSRIYQGFALLLTSVMVGTVFVRLTHGRRGAGKRGSAAQPARQPTGDVRHQHVAEHGDADDVADEHARHQRKSRRQLIP